MSVVFYFLQIRFTVYISLFSALSVTVYVYVSYCAVWSYNYRIE